MSTNIMEFRCKHRHSAFSHPRCYLNSLQGKSPTEKLPKVLLFDIETSPLEAYVFQKSIYKANITSDQIISEWYMLCWSAKWLLSDQIYSATLTGKEAAKENDGRIVKGLWELLNDADIVIAHNGDGFDIPNMNTRFIVTGLPPTSPYQTIDTMLVARKQFGFTHNSLDALAKLFKLGEKKPTDFELWKQSKKGDEKSLTYMTEYNREDVRLLEEVYLKLRPWIKGHPNMGLYLDGDAEVCANCGSSKIVWIPDKYYYTQTQKYPVFQCECGAFGRSRHSVLTAEEKQNLVVGLAK